MFPSTGEKVRKYLIDCAHYKFILINHAVQWFRVVYSKGPDWILPPQLRTWEHKRIQLPIADMNKIFQKPRNVKNKVWYWNLWCSMWVINLNKISIAPLGRALLVMLQVSEQSCHIHHNAMHLLHMTCHHPKPLHDHLLKGSDANASTHFNYANGTD